MKMLADPDHWAPGSVLSVHTWVRDEGVQELAHYRKGRMHGGSLHRGAAQLWGVCWVSHGELCQQITQECSPEYSPLTASVSEGQNLAQLDWALPPLQRLSHGCCPGVTRVGSHPKAGLGKDLLPCSCGYWQHAVPQGCWQEGLLALNTLPMSFANTAGCFIKASKGESLLPSQKSPSFII